MLFRVQLQGHEVLVVDHGDSSRTINRGLGLEKDLPWPRRRLRLICSVQWN